MIFIKKLNHWIMQFMAKSRTVISLSLDLLFEEISRNNTFNLIYDLSSLSTPFRKWKRKEMKDRKYYKRRYVFSLTNTSFEAVIDLTLMLWSDIIFGSNVFSFVLIIFSYTVYTTPKTKTKQTHKQTNKQLLFVQSAPVKEYYGAFRQDLLLVVGEYKQARSC